MTSEGDNKDTTPKIDSQPSFIRLRGLPFSSTDADIKKFLDGVSIDKIKFTNGSDGRPTGEAYLQLTTFDDSSKAMGYNKQEIKGRYIEIFDVDKKEFDFVASRCSSNDEGKVVRLRGLPWSCTENDLKDFFQGLEIEEVVFGTTGGRRARPSGDAFVKFCSSEHAVSALQFDKKHLGPRYVEVFKSTQIEFNKEKDFASNDGSRIISDIRPLMSISQPPAAYQPASAGAATGYNYSAHDYAAGYGYGYGGYGYDAGYGAPAGAMGSDCKVYLRGLPFDADVRDIEYFFSPLNVVTIKLGINDSRRASGDAICTFSSPHETMEALNRNKQRMGKRYIEIFTSDDVPSSMMKLTWRDAKGGSGYGATPLMEADMGDYGPKQPRLSGRGGARAHGNGAPARGAPRGPRPRDSWVTQNESWAYNYDTYGDRHREAAPAHDPNAVSWGYGHEYQYPQQW